MEQVSPRSNAIRLIGQVQTQQQQDINTKGGSKKGRKRQRAGAGTVVVPSFASSGPPVSAPGQDVNSNSQNTNSTSLQTQANGSCDSCIGSASNTPHCQSAACNPQTGGGSCNGSGLIGPNQTWACMSGGKSRRKRRTKRKQTKKRKTKRKQTKKRKNKKSKKTKKTNNKK